MFLKSFLLFSCLVLYTSSASEVKPNGSDIQQLVTLFEHQLQNVSCRVPKINFTFAHNLCEKHQAMFCEVSEVLKNCTDKTIGKLQRLSHQMKGNVTCILQASGTKIPFSTFLRELSAYVNSLNSNCSNS